MAGASSFLDICPKCGGVVTIQIGDATVSGRLCVTPFRELVGERRVAWRADQGEEFALMADLVRLAVLACDTLYYLTLETDDRTLIPLGIAGGTMVNRRPLLDALEPRLHPRCSPAPRAFVEGPTLGRG